LADANGWANVFLKKNSNQKLPMARAADGLTEGNTSGVHGDECFVSQLFLTSASNMRWRACCAE